jgi:hypothetical protein
VNQHGAVIQAAQGLGGHEIFLWFRVASHHPAHEKVLTIPGLVAFPPNTLPSEMALHTGASSIAHGFFGSLAHCFWVAAFTVEFMISAIETM